MNTELHLCKEFGAAVYEHQLLKAVKAVSDVNSVRLAGEARVNAWGQECGQSW